MNQLKSEPAILVKFVSGKNVDKEAKYYTAETINNLLFNSDYDRFTDARDSNSNFVCLIHNLVHPIYLNEIDKIRDETRKLQIEICNKDHIIHQLKQDLMRQKRIIIENLFDVTSKEIDKLKFEAND